MGEGKQTAFFLTWLASPGRSWTPRLVLAGAPPPQPSTTGSHLFAPFSVVLDVESELTPYLSRAGFTWLVHVRVVCAG